MAIDPQLQTYGLALLKAVAKANGHPDPDGYAARVGTFFEEPASVDTAQAANGETVDPEPTPLPASNDQPESQ